MLILILKAIGPIGIAILIAAGLVYYLWRRKHNKGEKKTESFFAKIKELVISFYNAVSTGFKGESGFTDKTANILAAIIVALVIAIII